MKAIIESQTPILQDSSVKKALSSFINQPDSYKSKFLQSAYNVGFDGYSYIGQKDSLNQYDTDLLHSFVISDFVSVDKYPKEFHQFLATEWQVLTTAIKTIELELAEQLNLPGLIQLYQEDKVGYMMSCNFYPDPKRLQAEAETNVRLSSHKDASIFTTFPFGIDKGLAYTTNENNIQNVGVVNQHMFSFKGYFIEYFSNHQQQALQHQVDLPENPSSERFSFAVFSLPKPKSTFYHNGKLISGATYFNDYLSLF
ncbi:MAG: hypothetical protein BM564_01615 [Bacteroidetes bacterium MedPE-SWsnd-G2]|nr:MAG: hypothetical protein BM564_01615 [Bacteroidetes bacterium MedPE-SWsnd-G2]